MIRSVFCVTAFLRLVAATASAQSITAVVVQGDAIPGVGNVTQFDGTQEWNMAVNAGGTWLIECDTNHADTNADVVLLKNGVLFLRENDALPLPPGASLAALEAVTLNAGSHSGFNHDLGRRAAASPSTRWVRRSSEPT